MESKALFERDLLYPTENLFEFGSIHVSIFNPNKDARVPVIIENKTSHSLVKYIGTIVRVMQNEIFDRVFIDVRKNVDLFLAADEETSQLYNTSYVRIVFKGDSCEFIGVNSI